MVMTVPQPLIASLFRALSQNKNRNVHAADGACDRKYGDAQFRQGAAHQLEFHICACDDKEQIAPFRKAMANRRLAKSKVELRVPETFVAFAQRTICEPDRRDRRKQQRPANYVLIYKERFYPIKKFCPAGRMLPHYSCHAFSGGD
nr:hypothetical protein [Sphingobium sp. YR768]